jgi:hypothetical protein
MDTRGVTVVGLPVKLKVVYLDDQCAQTGVASLRVLFPAGQVNRLTRAYDHTLSTAGNPAVALETEENLSKSGDVRSDFSVRLDRHDVDVCFAGAGRELAARGVFAGEFLNGK